MMKKIVVFVLMLAALNSYSQAVLPTFWDFDSPIPAGWTESLGSGSTRYSQGQQGQSCRLDNTGEFILISFNEEPGQVQYYIKGQPASGGWNGNFVVEESVNGTVFTPIRTFTNATMPTSDYTFYTETANSTTRFIRFKFQQKVSGNVGLDEVTITTPTASDEQEINVSMADVTIPSGMNANIGNSASVVFTISNLGLEQPLLINDITLSGSNANQFSLSSFPSNIAAESSANFTLYFDGQGTGSKTADLIIASNDVDENPYIIHVYAVAGSLATEPTSQASSISFNGVTAWDFNVVIAGNASVNYLVLRKTGSAPTGVPEDGTTYVKGQWLGDAQVVYCGPSATFNARNVVANTSYHLKAFAFNGSDGFENYLTVNPTANAITTANGNAGTTYNNTNPNDVNFIAQLSEAINPANYTQVFYSNYIGTIVNEFYLKDTVENNQPMNAVDCQYSGYTAIFPAAFQFTSNGFSREHCYPQSWMPTNGNAWFENSHEYSDLHILLPTLQNQVNSVRSNYPYGDVVNPISSYLNTTYGYNSLNERVYTPQSKIKGDVARAVMYHAVKYTTSQLDFSLPEYISSSIPYGQDEYLLKKWHFADMPDNFEIARNEYVRSKQNNRNPFIDFPQFACYIRFKDMTPWEPEVQVNGNTLTALDPGIEYQWYLDGNAISGATSASYTTTAPGEYTVAVRQFEQCPLVGSLITQVVNVEEALSVQLYPNPSQGSLNLQLFSPQSQPLMVTIANTCGQIVFREKHVLTSGNNHVALDTELPAGVYVVTCSMGQHLRTAKWIVQ